jgi:uncharacterized protein (DUF983 family)
MNHSTFKAALKLKCPKCGKSDLFSDPNPYHFKKLGDMPVVCPNCSLPFTPEPGFYYGAMYVSYAVTVALSVFNFIWVYLIWGFVVVPYLVINSILLIVFTPLVFRYSRSFFLAMVFGVEEAARKKQRH